MKCPYCRADNAQKNVRCSACGKPLAQKLSCPSCGNELEAKIRFCSRCGASTQRRVSKNRAVRKPKVSAKKAKPRIKKEVLIAGVVVLIVAVAGLALQNALSSRGSRGLNSVSSLSSDRSQQVQRIALKFMCPCGNWELGLSVCTCDNPRGSQEVKGYIRQLLAQGSLEYDVLQAVQDRYGGKL